VKEPELVPLLIVNGVGAVSTVLTVDTTTLAPPVAVVFVSVTVHVLEPFGARLEGLQEMPEMSMGATRLIEALLELLP